MAKRRSPTFAVAAAGMLYLLNTLPVQAEMENTAQACTTLVEPARIPAKTKTLIKKKPRQQPQSKSKRIRESENLSRLLIEEAFDSKDVAVPSSGFWNPATVHFILDTGTAEGHAVDSTCDFIDRENFFTSESYTTGHTLTIQPLFLTTRRMHPFLGKFRYPLLQNPLSLSIGELYDLGEINDPGSRILGTHPATKNTQETTSSTPRKGSGSPFAYSYNTDRMSLIAGVSWINDIADSKGFTKVFEEVGFENASERVSGLNLNLGAKFRAFRLTGGYIRTMDNISPAPLTVEGSETEPNAWNGELAYTTELLRRETVLAVGYQKSSDSLRLYLPERRYITKASMALFDSTILSLEYHLDKDYAVEEGETDGEGYSVMTKIGFGF